ncbi:myosin light chain kinase, smooth muscle-like isoform X1 [Alligator sinensis]|uniref:Myosin light chain kinase, smooth muscle-like isoform X1 n=2 Tax=Alligator sinensis TaxID=38654 RepID=A0A1U7S908_ALLSI|nr:myosin light chain kinase, smooth muscle-like isoform X1 [Alligator sinensis]
MEPRANTTGENKVEDFECCHVTINNKEDVSDFYLQLEKLGAGKFGMVYKLQEKATGKIWAGKYFRTRTTKEKQAACKEVELMNLLHHPRLVQCLTAFQNQAELVMVMEYIAGGELFERILDDDFEHTEPTSVQYMRQILEGIQYVHHQSIVHLDLKPENIVCVGRSSHWVKIIDFGLARKLDPNSPVKVLHGTPEFMAPEVVSFEPVGFTTDMWSIGVICYILLSGDSPFQGSSDVETLNNITAAQWEFDEETFSEISEQAKEFISQLLQKDSRCRLSSDKALAHPWLKQLAPSATKTLSKERMKQFLARQKWQKTGKAVLALKRLSLLSHRLDCKVTDPDAQDKGELDHSQEKGEVFALQKPQVKQEPHFLESLQDLVEVEGSSACLRCHIESFPDPEVTWLRGDVPIQESPHLYVAYEENGSCSLTILELTVEDAGQYMCRAVNDVGEAECSARLTVCPQQKVTYV